MLTEQIPEVSTDEIAERVKSPEHTILDIRPIEAYNGWSLRGEARGGHIPGAKSIPLKWTQYMDWVEVLEEKQINTDQPLTVYGYGREDSEHMISQLRKLGYSDVSLYDKFLDEWLPDPDCPLDQLYRYRQLVNADWVHQLIKDEEPPEYEGNDFVVCHSHFDNYEDYLEGHIPGAIALNTNWLESTETWNRRSPGELRKTLKQVGIRYDTTVVVYGRFSYPKYDQDHPGKSAGHLGAIRCAAIMLYAGVEDMRILNGGITSWVNDGYELSKEEEEPVPVDDFGAEIPGHPEFMIDTPGAKKLIESDDGELVSVRSWREFIGEWSGYHYIDQKGRIPGAIFGNCGADAYHMDNYRNFDHTMREYQEIAEKWREGGITPDKHIAFYCGTGWRGSEAFMNAYLMGWPHISVYDGGWYEWSNDPDNPVETGAPAD